MGFVPAGHQVNHRARVALPLRGLKVVVGQHFVPAFWLRRPGRGSDPRRAPAFPHPLLWFHVWLTARPAAVPDGRSGDGSLGLSRSPIPSRVSTHLTSPDSREACGLFSLPCNVKGN